VYVGPDNHFTELNYLRSKYLALWLIFTLSRSYSKDAGKAIGQSARLRDETLLDWSVRPRVYFSDSVTLCVLPFSLECDDMCTSVGLRQEAMRRHSETCNSLVFVAYYLKYILKIS